MKRLLLISIIIMSVSAMYAQDVVLMPRTTFRNEYTDVLLTKDYDFCYYQSVALEFDMTGLNFDYKTMTLTLCETRYPTPEEEKTALAYEYPWHDKYEMKISKEQADALFSLFTSAVYSASYMSKGGIVTDGAFCQFTAGRRSANTNSPHSKSNSGRLLSVTRKIRQCVKDQDTKSIDSMMDEIKSLTDIFVSYYPCKIPEDSYIYNIHKKYKVKGPSVGLNY